MTSDITFICGACGVGKSSLIPHLRSFLDAERFSVTDFDAIALPGRRDSQWILAMAKKWVAKAVADTRTGVRTIVCGPVFLESPGVREVEAAFGIKLNLFFLDAKAETVRQRLSNRVFNEKRMKSNEIVIGTDRTASQWIARNVKHSEYFRRKARYDGYTIIPADLFNPKTIAKLIANNV